MKLEFQAGFIGNQLLFAENLIIYINENNRITTIEESSKQIKNNRIAFPGFFNAHVHTADIGLRGMKMTDLISMVGRGGIKQKYLDSLKSEKLTREIIKSYREAIKHGSLGWADFREGGLAGLIPYETQNELKSSQSFLHFARPSIEELTGAEKLSVDQSMINELRVGIRSARLYNKTDIELIQRHTAGLIFAHASEGKKIREEWLERYQITDIEWFIQNIDDERLGALVHLTQGESNDFELMKKHGVGGILCLRSNKITKVGSPPVNEMLDMGLEMAIGSDNAMFNELAVYQEFNLLNKYQIDPHQLLMMATINGAKMCELDWGIQEGLSNFLDIKIPNNLSSPKEIMKWLVTQFNSNNIISRYIKNSI